MARAAGAGSSQTLKRYPRKSPWKIECCLRATSVGTICWMLCMEALLGGLHSNSHARPQAARWRRNTGASPAHNRERQFMAHEPWARTFTAGSGKGVLRKAPTERARILTAEGARQDARRAVSVSDHGRHLDVALPTQVDDRELHGAAVCRRARPAHEITHRAAQAVAGRRQPNGIRACRKRAELDARRAERCGAAQHTRERAVQ